MVVAVLASSYSEQRMLMQDWYMNVVTESSALNHIKLSVFNDVTGELASNCTNWAPADVAFWNTSCLPELTVAGPYVARLTSTEVFGSAWSGQDYEARFAVKPEPTLTTFDVHFPTDLEVVAGMTAFPSSEHF
jgi:hypothetical protein